MKKKTSAVAIVVAVIFSIILFPFIFFGGVSSGLVFSLESVVAPNREEDIYQSFVDNGGVDWVYDLLIEGVEEGLADSMDGENIDINLDAKELFPKNQVETIVYEVYHAIIKGDTYRFDLSYQKNLMNAKLKEYFDTTVTAEIKTTIDENIEEEVRKEHGEAYDLLTESEKQEIIEKATEEATKIAMEEAEKLYETEVIAMLDTEISNLEDELSAQINSIYDMPEYQELKALEEENGYSLTDRTELCADVRLAGYILLGLTAFFMLVLLLCHLFRPSGFFTAGAFSLVTGGFMYILAKAMKGVLLSLISSELSVEFEAEEFPDFIMPMIEEVLGWLPAGFEKVGSIGLMAAVILLLAGILLLVIRKNKAAAEAPSMMEM